MEEACSSNVCNWWSHLAPGMDDIHTKSIHCISAEDEHNKNKLAKVLTIDKMPESDQILAKSPVAALKRHQHCSLFSSPIPHPWINVPIRPLLTEVLNALF